MRTPSSHACSFRLISAQQIPVHTLVQFLLPPNNSGSHHLVPKSKEQGQATKTLLGKIFDATGRKREMINLNGLCVEHPQEYSQDVRPPDHRQTRVCMDTMTAGDRKSGEVGRFPLSVFRRTWLHRQACPWLRRLPCLFVCWSLIVSIGGRVPLLGYFVFV